MDVSDASYYIIEKIKITDQILSLLQDGRIWHVSSYIRLQNELPFPMISCFASYDIKLFIGKVR